MDKKFKDNEEFKNDSNDFQPMDESQSKQNINQAGFNNYEESDNNQKSKSIQKPFTIFGGICIAACILGFIFVPKSPTVDTSQAAKDALKNQVSNSLSVGTVLLSEDKDIGAKDFTISHNKGEDKTKIWVWDYAAEDGDYVQILVNGKPITDSFFIKNEPKKFAVPSTGKVQIKGIKDGGGGITYAVRYDVNGENYFNSAPEGKCNTYTLIEN